MGQTQDYNNMANTQNAHNVQKIEDDELPVKSTEMVEVSKDDLAAFLKRLENVEAENKRLLSAADRNRLENYDNANKPTLLPEVSVTTLTQGGPLVVAWKLTSNDSFVDNGRMIEKQIVDIFYEDGTSETMPLISFYRRQTRTTIGEIIGKEIDGKTGAETLKLLLKDGRELKIGLAFVN